MLTIRLICNQTKQLLEERAFSLPTTPNVNQINLEKWCDQQFKTKDRLNRIARIHVQNKDTSLTCAVNQFRGPFLSVFYQNDIKAWVMPNNPWLAADGATIDLFSNKPTPIDWN